MNFIVQVDFSVKLTDLALTFFPRENLLIAKNQCHLPREKNQCQIQKFRQIDEFFQNLRIFYIKMKWFDEIFTNFGEILQLLENSMYFDTL